MANDSDPYTYKLINERAPALKWSDRASCDHTRGDWLVARGGNPFGGPDGVSMSGPCPCCASDSTKTPTHPHDPKIAEGKVTQAGQPPAVVELEKKYLEDRKAMEAKLNG